MAPYQDRDRPHDPEAVGLPLRPFLYTCDQLAALLSVTPETIKRSYLFFEGRSVGVPPRDLLRAVNIAPAGEKPEWRVLERELVRWMTFKGFRYYEHAWFTH